MCEQSLIGAIGIHHVYLWLSVSTGDKGDLATVWRPRRLAIVIRMSIGKPSLVGAVGVHDVYLILAIPTGGESDLRTVR